MTASTNWQLAREAAEQYETILVPSILGPAAQALVEWARPKRGDIVLDVGCGTGAATRFAAEKIGASGRAVGVDINAGMIEVARSLPPAHEAAVEWHEGSASALPLKDESVDVVLCAQALQFLADRSAALTDMYRVMRPGGRLNISLWCPLQESPYFHALVEAVEEHIGDETAAGLRAAFGLSDAEEIRSLLERAGLDHIDMAVEPIQLNLPPPEDFVPIHIRATPMALGYGAAPAEAQMAVVQDVVSALAQYRSSTGIRVPFTTHLATATK